MTTALLENTTRDEVWPGAVIDCDVHANVAVAEALFPYMSQHWMTGAPSAFVAGPSAARPCVSAEHRSACRPEWRPSDRPPASNVSASAQPHSRPVGVDRAIVNCYYARRRPAASGLGRCDGAGGERLAHRGVAGQGSATGRLARGAARDPAAMIEEIHRVGDHPGFVQVLLPVATPPCGASASTTRCSGR